MDEIIIGLAVGKGTKVQLNNDLVSSINLSGLAAALLEIPHGRNIKRE